MLRKMFDQMTWREWESFSEGVMKSLPMSQSAEDAVLDAVVKGLEKEARKETIRKSLPWLRRAAKNSDSNVRRHQEVEIRHQESVARKKVRKSLTPLEELELRELKNCIEEARRKLPVRCAEMMAWFLQDYSFKEIAEYMGTSVQKAYGLWCKSILLIRESLRMYLAEENGEE